MNVRTAIGNICFVYCFDVVIIIPRKFRNFLLRGETLNDHIVSMESS